jgi:hypothetical protein
MSAMTAKMGNDADGLALMFLLVQARDCITRPLLESSGRRAAALLLWRVCFSEVHHDDAETAHRDHTQSQFD